MKTTMVMAAVLLSGCLDLQEERGGDPAPDVWVVSGTLPTVHDERPDPTRADVCDVAADALCQRWAECFPEDAGDCLGNVRAVAAGVWELCPAGLEDEVVAVELVACRTAILMRGCKVFAAVSPLPAACRPVE